MEDRVRIPVAAGTFYPGSRDALRRAVNELLGEMPPTVETRGAVGLVIPHAGYPYSGRVAGAAFRHAAAFGRPETVVLLGANHSGLGPVAALSTAEAWRTPLGDVAVDRDATAELVGAGLKTFDAAFRREHSMEVQLPFLQALWGAPPPIVPICVRLGALQELGAISERLANMTRSRVAWIIASSDFTHYEPDAVARERDRLALDAVLAVDAAGFHRTCLENRLSICGVGAITALLIVARSRGWTRSALIAYETSGDTTGDRTAVVGYAAVSLIEEGQT